MTLFLFFWLRGGAQELQICVVGGSQAPRHPFSQISHLFWPFQFVFFVIIQNKLSQTQKSDIKKNVYEWDQDEYNKENIDDKEVMTNELRADRKLASSSVNISCITFIIIDPLLHSSSCLSVSHIQMIWEKSRSIHPKNMSLS